MFTNIVEDVLTSTSTTNSLSANMGRVLNESILALEERVEDLENSSPTGGSTTVRIWA